MAARRLFACVVILSFLVTPAGKPGGVLAAPGARSSRAEHRLAAGENAWARWIYTEEQDGAWNLYSSPPGVTSGPVLLGQGLSEETTVRVHPKGTDLLFSAKKYEILGIYRLNVETGQVTPLLNVSDGDATNPDWSPDGERVVYEKNKLDNQGIYILAGGGQTSVLIDEPLINERQPDWSPDGARIVYSANKSGWYSLWVIPPQGGATVVPNTAHNSAWPAWSPDNQRIAYTSDEDLDTFAELWLIDAGGANKRLLYDPSGADGDPPVDVIHPVWAPDGSRLGFTLATRGGEIYSEKTYNAGWMDMPGGEITVCEPVDHNIHLQDWYYGNAPDIYTEIQAQTQIRPGQPFQAEILYGNQGLNVAETVTLVLEIPTGVRVISPGIPAPVGNKITWQIGTLDPHPDESVLLVEFQLEKNYQGGPLVFRVEIRSEPPDPNLENNTAEESVTPNWPVYLPHTAR